MSKISEQTINIVYQTVKDVCKVRGRKSYPSREEVKIVLHSLNIIHEVSGKLNGVNHEAIRS